MKNQEIPHIKDNLRTQTEKLSISESDLMRCIFSFFDKKHIDRIKYFIQDLDEESKKKLHPWVIGNLENLLKYQKDYLEKHFSPLKFKKRIFQINPDLIWKNTINLNGGHAALDILLHTVIDKEKKNEIKIIERIYAGRSEIKDLETFNKIIKEENLQINHAKSYGILNEGDFHFCFDEYIDNGRHPDQNEFRDEWHSKSITHLWNNGATKFKDKEKYFLINEAGLHNLFSTRNDKEDKNIFIERIIEISKKSPSFIYHTDLHRFNILILPKKDFFIIDWAEWSIAKIGMGYPVKRRALSDEYFSNQKISEIIYNFFKETKNISLEEFSANFVLFNAHYSLEIDPALSNIFLNYFYDVFYKIK